MSNADPDMLPAELDLRPELRDAAERLPRIATAAEIARELGLSHRAICKGADDGFYGRRPDGKFETIDVLTHRNGLDPELAAVRVEAGRAGGLRSEGVNASTPAMVESKIRKVEADVKLLRVKADNYRADHVSRTELVSTCEMILATAIREAQELAPLLRAELSDFGRDMLDDELNRFTAAFAQALIKICEAGQTKSDPDLLDAEPPMPGSKPDKPKRGRPRKVDNRNNV